MESPCSTLGWAWRGVLIHTESDEKMLEEPNLDFDKNRHFQTDTDACCCFCASRRSALGVALPHALFLPVSYLPSSARLCRLES